MSSKHPRLPLSERAYRALLRLAPADFRAVAGDDMVAVFRDAHHDARTTRSPFAIPTLWFYALRDLVKTRRDLRRGRPALAPRPQPTPPGARLMIEGLIKDLRFAVRSLMRAPGFTAIVVLTLALGIGANTAIFSVVDAVLLRPLPFPEPGRLVAVWADYTRRDGPEREWLAYPDFEDLRALPVMEEASTFGSWGPTLVRPGGDPVQINGAAVNEGLFSRVLGVAPALGRGFVAEDDIFEAPPVVLLSHRLWTQSFESDQDVVGSSINLNGIPFTVIGVMPAGFRPPFIANAELWRPMAVDRSRNSRGNASFRSIGRLAAGVDLATARAAADTLGKRLEAEFPNANQGVGFSFNPLHEDIVAAARTALWVLLAAVGFVLLMACVNIANLLLSQATSRHGELAVRAALGASRRRIVQQLLSESLLLAVLGGVLGALVGVLGTRFLVDMAPTGTPRIGEVVVDLRVLAFTVAATLASAVLFGLVPAIRAARTDLHDALKEGGRGSDSGAHGRTLRSALVVVQVALALVLLVGAGLLVRTFQELNAVDLGFDTDSILSVSLNLPVSRYEDRPAQAAFYQELEQRLGAIPGVTQAGAVNSLPLSGNDGDANFQIEGQPLPPPDQQRVAWIRRTSPGYLGAIGLRMISGRFFGSGDDAEAASVVVINETLARRYFENEDPVGQRIYFGGPDNPNYRLIVGVVSDIKNFSVAGDSRNAIYFPYAQVATGFMTLVLRTGGDPESLIPTVRREIAAMDSTLAASGIATMDTIVSASLAAERFVATLMSAFAVVAMVLAVVGLYGVVSYSVSLRQHEMGVRLALGASGRDIARLVVGSSVLLVAIGVGVGVAGALAVARLLEGLLFGVATTDPTTFVTVIVALASAGFVAALVPAVRASRVDPVSVLNPD